MGKTEAQKRAQKGYMAKFSRVEVRLTEEKQKRVQDHAQRHGESVNAFINRAVDETMARDEAGQGGIDDEQES